MTSTEIEVEQTALPPNGTGDTKALKPTSLAELKRSRELTVPGPSGNVYRIRPLNLQRHALAGGFPGPLQAMAVRQAMGHSVLGDLEDPSDLVDRAGAMGEYLDEVVLQELVQPKMTRDDLDALPPPDWDWLVNIALGNVTVDGAGHPLWDRERIGRFPEAAKQ